MLFLVAAKRKLCSAISQAFTSYYQSLKLLHPPCRGYASNKNRPTNSMLVDYLVATYGFSPDKAALVSKRAAHLKSPDKPEAVRSFLNKEGFSDAHVKTIITLCPNLLYASPENTIDPNLRALRSTGLSSSGLNQFILSSPTALQISTALPRIKFWMDFFSGDEAALLKAFKHSGSLIGYDISRNIAPRVSLFESHGLSNCGIQRIMLTAPRVIMSRISLLEDSLKRAKELGFRPESGMFVDALQTMVAVSREALQKKMELFKCFGWSEDEFLAAVRKAPRMVALTENSLQAKMNFLVEKARCEPSYIASCPKILTYSLDKRMKPRLNALNLLESKGLSSKRLRFYTVLHFSDKAFVDRFIVPHKEGIAGLHEAYLAACA